MKNEASSSRLLMKRHDIRKRLGTAFALLFLLPTLGVTALAIRYQLMDNVYLLGMLLCLLLFAWVGFSVLRRLFDEIRSLSQRLAVSPSAQGAGRDGETPANELHSILQTFGAIESRLHSTSETLKKRTAEITTLKELAEIRHATLDPLEILTVTLERGLTLTDSQVGSVLLLEQGSQTEFVVKATVGTGEAVKVEDRIDFDTSIAKYAVINRSPVVVADIEGDCRFGRANRPAYGSKSFICMPVKTSREIVGVLTIASRNDDRVYNAADVEILAPLVSNAALTYENLQLLRSADRWSDRLKAIDKVFKLINSSFKGSELLQAVLREIEGIVPFRLALVLTRPAEGGATVRVDAALASGGVTLPRGVHLTMPSGSVVQRVLRGEAPLIVEDTDHLADRIDRVLFSGRGRKAAILLPLRLEGSIRGVLALCAPTAGEFHACQDLLEWMAGGLSLAIERNTLWETVIQRKRELDSMKQIGNALATSTFEMQKVLRYTMDMVRMIMNVEAGSLYLLNDDVLSFAVAFNIKLKSMKRFQLKLGQGIAGHVAARGKSVIVNDTRRSPHFFHSIDHLSGFKTRSALCVPMISKGKVIGAIEILNKISGHFDANDEDLLQAIASSVSIAIENAGLYKATVAMAEHERSIRNMFQKFVPKAVVDKIIHGYETGREVLEEVRTLTLLNIDIRGFSPLSRAIGPQKTVTLLNLFFDTMGRIVFKHNGIVDKYLGDGFLAVFGAPVSSIQDADNAVVAALEMKSALGELNAQLARHLGVTIHFGISIHTGEVVVGNFGFDMKMDYTVIGDAVNDVFRLQEYTKTMPNRILISDATSRATRSRIKVRGFRFAPGPDHYLQNQKIFELLGRHVARAETAEEEGVPLPMADASTRIGKAQVEAMITTQQVDRLKTEERNEEAEENR